MLIYGFNGFCSLENNLYFSQNFTSACAGDRLICTKENPCDEWKGHCTDLDNHLDCHVGLRCGKNNCQTKLNGGKVQSNCCFKSQGKVMF